MNGIYIMYNRALDKEIVDLLIENNFTGYTKWRDVQGSGNKEPHLGDSVWPQLSNMLFLAVKTDTEKRLLSSLMNEIKKRHPAEGVQMFSFKLTEML